MKAQAALASVLYYFDWDWAGAEQAFRRALDRNAGSSLAHWQFGIFLFSVRRTDDAMVELRKACDLDPLWPNPRQALGCLTICTGQYDESREHHRKALELDPGYALAHSSLGLLQIWTGSIAAGLSSLTTGATMSARSPLMLAFLAWGYVQAGRRDDAIALRREVQERAQSVYVSPKVLADFHGILGDADEAFRCLDQAYAERDPQLAMATSPTFEMMFDSSDPRFQALLRRMNFPETATSPTAPTV